MLSEEVTSSARSWTLGRLVKLVIFEMLRVVAKTFQPCFWKEKAKPAPIPPSLQPVMRTDFGDIS